MASYLQLTLTLRFFMDTNHRLIKFENQIIHLESYLEELKKFESLKDKLNFFDETTEIKKFLSSHSDFRNFFEELKPKEQMMLKSLVLIGQENVLLSLMRQKKIEKDFLETLLEINHFYDSSHGLISYQITILKLILDQERSNGEKSNGEKSNGEKLQSHSSSKEKFLKPQGVDLSIDSKSTRALIRIGLENLDKICEIYPVGGAGERLKLTSAANEPLPVAKLPFLGLTLLEALVRDLQGREFLYFKLIGKQLLTPIAMMTSDENNNDEHIRQLCKSRHWFHRGIKSFHLFTQPMVPVVTVDGDWLLTANFKLMCKPSGHGVIWKLASEMGIFSWFKQHGRTKMLSRQINNPIAGVDSGLLGFLGVGFKKNKVFGFASCDRVVGSSEGMDVVIETKTENGYAYKITNVEYTEFVKKGIEDQPEEENGKISKFPANTNILFVDISKVDEAIKKLPIPGMLVNLKCSLPIIDGQGQLKKIKVSRLESTMQNIADEIIDTFDEKLKEEEYQNLSSYITFNERNKTIAVTKKSYSTKCFEETPQSSFYEILKNSHVLLKSYCGMSLPSFSDPDVYLAEGPSLMVNYHPALGPDFSVIAQKLRKGQIAKNSELQLEIAELDMENLELDGSLLIHSEHVLGSDDEMGILQYGKNVSKCCLKNIKVKNFGINREADNHYWKNEIKRHESLKINLHGHSEFVAENVEFNGNLKFDVMDGQRMIVTMQNNKPHYSIEKLEKNSEYWSYAFDDEDRIILKRQ